MSETCGAPVEALDIPVSDRSRTNLALIPLLDARAGRSPSPTREEIEALPEPPANGSDVRFDYNYDELLEIAAEYTPAETEDLQRVTRYALVWSGVRVADELTHWTTLDHGYKPGTRLPRVTMPVNDKRLSVRVVPEAWDGDYGTAFRLRRKDEGGNVITLANRDGLESEVARPHTRYVTESVQTLAYLVDQADGTKNITINPLQRCPQTCMFCCRGYHDMTSERKKELINLSPDEMARALRTKYPKQDWGSVAGITLITGDFRDEGQILDYLEEFTATMDTMTGGQWNPQKNDNQDISISTHLLKSGEGMERAKRLGMKRFIHTVEMVDDANREAVMHLGTKEFKPSPLNKGNISFSDILGVLATALDIYGEENVEPVLVIGLDPLERTKRAMDALREIGITRVSRGLVNVYDMNQFGLMAVPFEEAVAGMQYARDVFQSPYRRVITNFQNANELQKD